MRTTDNHMDANEEVQSLIERIESSPQDFKHLQVFLHRVRDNDSRPNNLFLMVSPRVFGKIEVRDLKVEGDYINIEFLDCAMQEVGNIRINIDDDKPQVLFVSWQDVRKMVLDETTSRYCVMTCLNLITNDYEQNKQHT